VSRYHYTLRADGKRLSVAESGSSTSNATTSYTYDNGGKLTQEAGPYATIAYTYDSVGNRLTRTVTNAATGNGTSLVNGTTSSAYDQNDRMTTGGHTYDADGNETMVNGQAASYDFENHLVGLGNAATAYAYDADGNRVSVSSAGTTTSYVVDDSLPYASVVEEYSGGSLAARYDYGDDLIRMDRGSGVYYYLYDGLGSTRQLVNTSGTVTDSYGYSAFGEMAADTGNTANPFLFNAQQFDRASGDYYLRARYYDQSNGRFISQDPFAGDEEDPISLHRYLYASNNPVSRVDPGGEEDTLVGSLTSFAVNATLSAAFGAVVGAGVAGGDAFFQDKPGTDIISAEEHGALQGAEFGALGAVRFLQPVLLAYGAISSIEGISAAYDDGNYGLAAYRLTVGVGLFGVSAYRGTPVGGDAAAGDVNLMSPTDNFYKYTRDTPSLDGYYDVVAHGTPNKIQVVGTNSKALVGSRIMARIIQSQPDYQGQPIRLLSCSTGALPQGVAQGLANELGVEVLAPSDVLWAHEGGRLTIGRTSNVNTGSFIKFEPNK